MAQKKNNLGKAVELRSEEVQEVMNRIPSMVVRWGMTIMAVVVVGLLVTSAYIRWPQTIECPFEWIPNENKSEIIATLSPEALTHITAHKDIMVTLYSPIFSDEYSEKGVSGTIIGFTMDNSRSGSYVVTLNIDLPDKIIKEGCGPRIVGNLMFLISDDTLLKHIVDHTKLL